MTENRIQKSIYMPGLDGLRALAVFAVIGFHLSLPFTSGGFLGVTLFFALSGYLITDILLSEWAGTSTISLKSFFIRRAKRLLPGVIFLLACVSSYIAFLRPEFLQNLRSAIGPALFFVSNWWYIFSGTPYFASSGMPSVLNHFWSLAVEAQFYLVWPFLLLAMLRIVKKKWLMVTLTVALAVLSAGLMAVLYQPGTDPSRVYYGTDTRIFTLLLGASLAMVCPSSAIGSGKFNRTSRLMLDIVGILALLFIVYEVYHVSQNDDGLYTGGMFLFSVISLVLVAVAAMPSTLVGRLFSLKPLKFIGNISYGMYLWQFPVIVISNAIIQPSSLNPWLITGQLVSTVLLAAFSYYVVEKPVRKGHIIEALRQFNMKTNESPWRKKAAIIVAVVFVLVSGVGLLLGKPISDASESVLSSLPSEVHIAPTSTPAPTDDAETASSSPEASATPTAPATSSPDTPRDNPSDATITPTPTSPTVPAVLPVEPVVPSDLGVTLIGDSIGIDVTPYLQKHFPNMTVEAKVGRQFYEAKGIIQQLLENNTLAKTVIIELGSNGSVRESNMRELIDLIGSDRKIIFVNTQVPRSWCAGVNSTLAKVCAEYTNTAIADWYSASLNQSGYFYKDNVHPNGDGSRVMAKVIADSVTAMQATE